MLELQHLSDVFEVYILVGVRIFDTLSYTSKLFSFVCSSPSLLLLSRVFQQTIQY